MRRDLVERGEQLCYRREHGAAAHPGRGGLEQLEQLGRHLVRVRVRVSVRVRVRVGVRVGVRVVVSHLEAEGGSVRGVMELFEARLQFGLGLGSGLGLGESWGQG